MTPSHIPFGPIGIWTTQLDYQPAAKAQEAAAELERLGFGAIWIGEAVGREALTHAALLLAGTSRIVIATGIANIYARDPTAMSAAHKTLTEAYPGRFVLGLGVSHLHLVEKLRGHRYQKPLTAMREYLDAMDHAIYRAALPKTKPVRVLAALGPKMLELAAHRADGAHPYNVTPEHTAQAREILGKGPWLCPEQAVILETDRTKAHTIARAFLSIYLTLPNYSNNLLRLGFHEDDFQNGGSDRLIDALVAWGGLRTITDRVRAHHAAGADHVCVQVLTADPQALPSQEWREIASALLPA
jgi:probable F420-dependent oxidoreductase